MNCAALERWLDEGRPAAARAAADAHAGTCPRCAAALRAALELEELLERPPAAAPASLTDRVMARIAAATPPVPVRIFLPSPFSWWVRAAAQPATALAAALAAIVIGQWRSMLVLASRIGAWTDQVVGPLSGLGLPRQSPLADPATAIGLTLALAPLAVWAAWWLYHWSERLVERRARTA